MIFVESKKKKLNNLKIKYPNAEIIDITSKGKEPNVKFSPFYPHGNIPVPFTENEFAMTVEGIWQGLKVFNDYDIDISKFYIKDMTNIKRTERKYGKVIGHRMGVHGNKLLNYGTARKEIYLRTYAWVLDNLLTENVKELKEIALQKDLVLLDYATNLDIDNLEKPLSHAGLVKRYIEKKYPKIKEITFSTIDKTEITKQKKRKKKKEKPKNSRKRKRNKKKINENQEQLELFNN